MVSQCRRSPSRVNGFGGCLISTEPYSQTTDRSFDAGDADALAVSTESGDVTLASL